MDVGKLVAGAFAVVVFLLVIIYGGPAVCEAFNAVGKAAVPDSTPFAGLFRLLISMLGGAFLLGLATALSGLGRLTGPMAAIGAVLVLVVEVAFC